MSLIKTQDIDAALLEKYIEDSGLKVGYITDSLGISRQAFDKKRKGKVAFRASEVFVLCTLLKIPDAEKPKIFCL